MIKSTNPEPGEKVTKIHPITPDKRPQTEENPNRIFAPVNIWMMIGCVALIIIGFLLMSGGGSSIENGFNPDIFSTRRIVVGPTIAFLGFLLMAFAIVWKPRKAKKSLTK